MRSKIWTPAPIAICGARLFSAPEIEAYERDILANGNATEHDASRFFQKFPKFLHFGAGAEIRREVVLLGSKERVDFFRRSYGESYWDIIELKHPHKQLVADVDSLHPRLSADVDKAINQALDYRDLIDMNGEVRSDLKKKGIAVCRPQITVVVGQDSGNIDPETLRLLYDRVRNRGAIDPKSYTDIYNFAKENYSRSKAIIIPTFHFASDPAAFPDTVVAQLVELVASDPNAVFSISPLDFERLVAHIIESFGFSVELTPMGADGGKDIIAIQEGIGTSKFLIECKRYRSKVGLEVVRAMHGLVMQERATKGMIVTSSGFTAAATEYLEQHKYILDGVDHGRLLQWIHDYRKRERGDLL
jgi:HJR/Mrr/RecB family endonuclease